MAFVVNPTNTLGFLVPYGLENSLKVRKPQINASDCFSSYDEFTATSGLECGWLPRPYEVPVNSTSTIRTRVLPFPWWRVLQPLVIYKFIFLHFLKH